MLQAFIVINNVSNILTVISNLKIQQAVFSIDKSQNANQFLKNVCLSKTAHFDVNCCYFHNNFATLERSRMAAAGVVWGWGLSTWAAGTLRMWSTAEKRPSSLTGSSGSRRGVPRARAQSKVCIVNGLARIVWSGGGGALDQ